jgi:hypothetical protein
MISPSSSNSFVIECASGDANGQLCVMTADKRAINIQFAIRRSTDYKSARFKKVLGNRFSVCTNFYPHQVVLGRFLPSNQVRHGLMFPGAVLMFAPIEFFGGAVNVFSRYDRFFVSESNQ